MDPLRPTGKDLSLKWPSHTTALLWYGLGTDAPRTASQGERMALEQTQVLRTFELVWALGDLFPQAASFTYGVMAAVTPRLIPQYENSRLLGPGGGVWGIPQNGHLYSFPRYAWEHFRSGILGNAKLRPQVVERLAANPDLRDLLDLNETCDDAATWAFGPIPAAIDKLHQVEGAVDTTQALPVMDETQIAALEMARAAHVMVSLWKQGLGPEPPPDIVASTQYDFEATAANPTQQTFFALRRFTGRVDPAWTPAEVGQWAAIQDTFHERWFTGLLAADPKATWEAATDHFLAHLAMNDANTWLLFSCGNGPLIANCPAGPGRRGKMTARQALPVLLERLGL